MEVFYKAEINLSQDPAIPFLCTKDSTSYHRGTCSSMSIAVLVIIARNRKKPRYPSIDKWVTEIWHIYTMKNYSAVWKNEII